jgi:hypothetical protein
MLEILNTKLLCSRCSSDVSSGLKVKNGLKGCKNMHREMAQEAGSTPSKRRIMAA